MIKYPCNMASEILELNKWLVDCPPIARGNEFQTIFGKEKTCGAKIPSGYD